MKFLSSTSFFLLSLLLLIGCSAPSLEEALKNKNVEVIDQVMKSGAFDPNMVINGNETLFEHFITSYYRPDWVVAVAAHPNLTMQSRNDLMKRIVNYVSNKDGYWYTTVKDKDIPFDTYAPALYQLTKPVPDDQAEIRKFSLTEDIHALYDGGTIHIFKENQWVPIATDNVLDVLTTPVYEDLVPASPGKELVIYVLHPAGMSPKAHVEVYADPFVNEDKEYYTREDWEELLLFAGTYTDQYRYDGNNDFPDNVKILYNSFSSANQNDYSAYIKWISENLTESIPDDAPPAFVPDRFSDFTNFDNYLPIAIETSSTDDGADLILFQSVYSFGEPTYDYLIAAYQDEKLTFSDRFLEGEDQTCPLPQVSLEAGKIKVFREGCSGDAGEPGTEFSYADSTYLIQVMLLDSDNSKQTSATEGE